jgi:DNA-binding transcriptional LysR family regulator
MVAAADGDPDKQSHYSRQVKDLESALDTKLFTKVGKFLRPTEQGKQLAALTNLYFAGLQDMQRGTVMSRPLLRLAAGEGVLRWLVFPHLSEILAAVDQQLIEFVTSTTGDVIDGVRTGKFELGIVREDAVEESLASIGSGALDYAFVVPRNLLPGRSAAGIEQVKRLPVAAITGGGQFARNSLDLLKRNGIEPVIRLRTQSLSLVIEAVRTASVAAFVPEPAARDFPQDHFAVVELEGLNRLGRRLHVVYEPAASALRPVARALGSKIAQICRPSKKLEE